MSEVMTEFEVLFAAAHDEVLSGSVALVPADRQPILNGVPYKAFRQSLSVDDRRVAGTFFSGQGLAQRLAAMLWGILPIGARVIDPTCGIGDLLLAYAERLPVEASLVDTLIAWGEQLAGIDQREDLVAMAKVRLVALARARGRFDEPIALIDDYFPHLIAGDMLAEGRRIAAADAILFNPPFGQTTDHSVTDWSSGKVSAAALFLDAVVRARSPGAPIAAVLPDVLRCGSRYERFRAKLSQAGLAGDFATYGRFDPWTDVDVFTSLLQEGEGPLWATEAIDGEMVGDHFVVRVGPVVPHRHKDKGTWRRFICAKSVPAWSRGFTPTNSRRFEGTVFSPPFVVVRRTSSPSDNKRAVGAIITGDRPVAVENHLIVLQPVDGRHESCVALLAILEADDTTNHLNRVIRCRHLTVGSVKAIPWLNAS